MSRIGDERDEARRLQERRTEEKRQGADERSRQEFGRVLEQRRGTERAPPTATREQAAAAKGDPRVLGERAELARKLARRLLARGKKNVLGVDEQLRERTQDLRRRSDDARRRKGRGERSPDDAAEGAGASAEGGGVLIGGSSSFGSSTGSGQGEADREQAEAPVTTQRTAARAQIDELRDQILKRLDDIIESAVLQLTEDGLTEVVIELRDGVLAGGSLRLRCEGRKVSATFVADDTDVRRLLKASEGPLARALARRSMTLERFVVEAPA